MSRAVSSAFVGPGLRAAAVMAVWVVILSGAPWLASVLDHRGLPGGTIALIMLIALASLSAVMVMRSLPKLRRIRTLASAARSGGYGWHPRLRIPNSMFQLPSFRGGSMTVQLFNLVVLEREANATLVFDVAELPDPGYGDTSWRTSAAKHVPYDLPALVVEPRRVAAVDLADGLDVVGTELASVNARWRVRTEDRAFATAFLDQRMLAWIDGLEEDVRLETGGPWLLISSSRLAEPDEWQHLLDRLDAFERKVPRVTASLYPGETSALFLP